MAAEWDKDGYNTAKAIILSKAMRKITNLIGREKILLIFTNQLRSRMNAPAFSDPWTTSGGKAIAFHASVRLRLSPSGMIKEGPQGKQEVTGINTTAKVVKNRMGPPLRVITYPIYFNRGIDNINDIITKYAPPSDNNNTADYIANVRSRMQTALAGTKYAKLNSTTPLTFKGAKETDLDNIKMFKALCNAILVSEGGSFAKTVVDLFDIKKLA
jgi:hypothetical protein